MSGILPPECAGKEGYLIKVDRDWTIPIFL